MKPRLSLSKKNSSHLMICSGRLVFYIQPEKMESLSGVFHLMMIAFCVAIHRHSGERQIVKWIFLHKILVTDRETGVGGVLCESP